MTHPEAETIVINIRAKGEKAFTEEFGIEQGVYSESRAPFLLGYIQALFIETLVISHKPVMQ